MLTPLRPLQPTPRQLGGQGGRGGRHILAQSRRCRMWVGPDTPTRRVLAAADVITAARSPETIKVYADTLKILRGLVAHAADPVRQRAPIRIRGRLPPRLLLHVRAKGEGHATTIPRPYHGATHSGGLPASQRGGGAPVGVAESTRQLATGTAVLRFEPVAAGRGCSAWLRGLQRVRARLRSC